ncbi:hypothetical protein CUMW_176360 [Citrus unshiu]|uniref:Uncharacterized protein n=1 Tax=Citrus unshiu TaxID=55188 RepID=A0A2H5PXE1_CITUN|nr:hypothetical protein CUMW_176360 [Citrus unshiu]
MSKGWWTATSLFPIFLCNLFPIRSVQDRELLLIHIMNNNLFEGVFQLMLFASTDVEQMPLRKTS